MVVWFTTEYALRVWSAGCRSRYQGLFGRKMFILRPSCILDGVIIVASVVVLGVGSSGKVFYTSALRGLRFFQILRMMRMDRRGGTWKLLGSVVWAHRQELLTTLYIGFLGLIFSSFIVFMLEKEVNAKFKNYADALWWGVITLCTVGYGDAVPITWAGKIIASFCALLGISFFALPAGILGSGFALKVQQQQRQKHLIRRRVPAAMLIQCLWRCYAADEHSRSIATWKRHLKPAYSNPIETVPVKGVKHQSSFVSRFSTRRKDRSPNVTTTLIGQGNVLFSQPLTELSDISTDNIFGSGRNVRSQTDVGTPRTKRFDSEEDELNIKDLTSVHKNVIRSLRKIQLFVARRKFREALRPYDVKDVMEQYSSGHVDMLSRLKVLQCRLDQILGKVGSKAKDVYDSKQSLASRIVSMERQVRDIDNKVDDFIDIYKEDRRKTLLICKYVEDQLGEKLVTSQKKFLDKVPSTVLAKRLQLKPPMQRNSSDLGSRIKKRVTYSSLGDISSMTAAHSNQTTNRALLSLQSVNCDSLDRDDFVCDRRQGTAQDRLHNTVPLLRNSDLQPNSRPIISNNENLPKNLSNSRHSHMSSSHFTSESCQL